MPGRAALSPERIVDAAARVADRGGIGRVSMRTVSAELGVEAMSLYHHLPGKGALLDGLADWVFIRIDLPEPQQPWRPAMVARAESARRALAEHPWALTLIESRRTPGPALLQHHDTVLGCLRGNGFSVAVAAHTFSAIDAYVYGFVLTELNLPFDAGRPADDFAAEIQRFLPADTYPHLAEMITTQALAQSYTFADEFAFGLDLILSGVERLLAAGDS